MLFFLGEAWNFFNDCSISIIYFAIFINKNCPVSWSCRIHRLLLCWVVRLPTNKCSGYDMKQSDGEVPVMLELWGMRSAPLLPLLLGPLWPEVVAPDRVLSINQMELNCVLMLNWIVWNRTVLTFNCVWTKTILILNWIVWNRTVFWHWNCALMLNWIAWNGTILTFKLCTYA